MLSLNVRYVKITRNAFFRLISQMRRLGAPLSTWNNLPCHNNNYLKVTKWGRKGNVECDWGHNWKRKLRIVNRWQKIMKMRFLPFHDEALVHSIETILSRAKALSYRVF